MCKIKLKLKNFINEKYYQWRIYRGAMEEGLPRVALFWGQKIVVGVFFENRFAMI